MPEFLCNLQAQGLEPDDPTHSYMLQAGARLCKCLGEEFVPYLSVVMPPLMHAAELKLDISVQEGSDSEAEDDDEDDEVLHSITVKRKMSVSPLQSIFHKKVQARILELAAALPSVIFQTKGLGQKFGLFEASYLVLQIQCFKQRWHGVLLMFSSGNKYHLRLFTSV